MTAGPPGAGARVPGGGRVALVAGGTGAVGEGVVRALAGAGADVVVPSRDQARLDALAGLLPDAARLHGIVGDIADEQDAERVRRDVQARVGPPDLVVVSVGGWRSGPPLTETPVQVWRDVVAANLLPHVVAARTFLPALAERPAGRYVVVVGDTAERPVRGAAPVSVVATAVLSLARAARLEVPEVAVTALVLGVVRTRARPGGDDSWVTADDVGRVVVELAEGRRPEPEDGVLRLPDRRDL